MDIPLKKNYSPLLFYAPAQKAAGLPVGLHPELPLNKPTRVRVSKKTWKKETAFFTAGWSFSSLF